MKNLTLRNIAYACGGNYCGPETEADREITAVITDSRKIVKGCLFAAIKGERSDGHDFIRQAYEDGAICVISEKEPEDPVRPCIRVVSTLEALRGIAGFYRRGLNVKVVGITGSVGKTSTKEMIASVLSQRYRVLKTHGNFNNGLGLPLTVFRLNEEDEVAVLEMGISDFGEMHMLSEIARPDICVFTNIGICHLEQLHTRDGILKAKTEMFDYMQPDGSVVINGDDDRLALIKQVKGRAPYRFGCSEDYDVYLKESENLGLKGTKCIISTPGGDVEAMLQIPGKHMLYNAMAGAMVGFLMGLEPEEIRKGIESLKPLDGRNHLIETGYFTIIDDCYNANPVSMCASIDVMKNALTRRVFILGDMGELGKDEVSLHERVGKYAAESGADLAVFIGRLAQHMAEGFRSVHAAGRCVYFETVEEFTEHASGLLRRNDTVLVKASHFMNFNKIIEFLAAFSPAEVTAQNDHKSMLT